MHSPLKNISSDIFVQMRKNMSKSYKFKYHGSIRISIKYPLVWEKKHKLEYIFKILGSH